MTQPGMQGRFQVTSGWKGEEPGQSEPLIGTTHRSPGGRPRGTLKRLIAKFVPRRG
jgi:hypothetical protein